MLKLVHPIMFCMWRESQEKRCIKCDQIKNIEDYPIMVKHATVPPKRRAHCKECDKKLAKQRRELKKTYGEVPEGHYCPVCLRGEAELREKTEQKSLWALDHDHITGAGRGWLCHPCNRAIGALGDNIDNLARAILHLKKSEDR